ncbi:UNVERIFIED_ORG: peptidoglycan/LPS O-acetylase OafA/YrhL [Arthrobacter sp. UYCu721]
MSDDNPEEAWSPLPPPREEEPPPEPRRGSIALGILLGTVALYALYFGTTAGIAPDEGYKTFLAGPAALIPIGAYLAIAGALAIRSRTSRWGAGLLIGLGIFILLGGGICVMALSQMSRRI